MDWFHCHSEPVSPKIINILGGLFFVLFFTEWRNKSKQGDDTSYTSLMVRSDAMKLTELDDDM